MQTENKGNTEAPRALRMAEEEKKQLTLRVPADVHKKIRLLAALNEKTMTEYFVSLIEEEYKKHAKDTGPVQLKLPT